MWEIIKGFKYQYRISDRGVVEKRLPNGEWLVLTPVLIDGTYVIRFRTVTNRIKAVSLSKLMDRYFFGGKAKKNHLYAYHKNGSKKDCSVSNLKFVTKKGLFKLISKRCGQKAIVKVNTKGKVIARYDSITEAAAKNFVSRTVIYRRVSNKIKDPYDENGFTYKFESEVQNARRRKKAKTENQTGESITG